MHISPGDTKQIVEQARLSAEVTHTHHDGQVGAIAVALAAAFASHKREALNIKTGDEMFQYVLEHTPKSETRNVIEKASAFDRELSVQTAASLLGSGYNVTSQDTVPFSLWCAARHLDDYEAAMWTTMSRDSATATRRAPLSAVSWRSPRRSRPFRQAGSQRARRVGMQIMKVRVEQES